MEGSLPDKATASLGYHRVCVNSIIATFSSATNQLRLPVRRDRVLGARVSISKYMQYCETQIKQIHASRTEKRTCALVHCPSVGMIQTICMEWTHVDSARLNWLWKEIEVAFRTMPVRGARCTVLYCRSVKARHVSNIKLTVPALRQPPRSLDCAVDGRTKRE